MATLIKQRPQLTPEQQIKHLKEKGIKFDYISEQEAEKYLSDNNNYFKIRAYRKNFPKHIAGEKADTYINLDFAMLKDLSIIDMRLRYILLLMALDIEHFEKVALLKEVSLSEDNGYDIVTAYIDSLKEIENDDNNDSKPYSYLLAEINKNRNNEYTGGIIEKYENNYPIWAFVEIISFGSFISFLKFCGEYLKNKKFIDNFYILNAVKRIRNASAHNSCVIHDLHPNTSKHKSNYNVIRFFRKDSMITKASMDSQMSNAAIRDIATLIYAHTTIVTSDGVKDKRGIEIKNVINRCYRNIDYYNEN